MLHHLILRGLVKVQKAESKGQSGNGFFLSALCFLPEEGMKVLSMCTVILGSSDA